MTTSRQPAFDGLAEALIGAAECLGWAAYNVIKALVPAVSDRHRLREVLAAARLTYTDARSGGVNLPRIAKIERTPWGRQIVFDLHPCPGLTYHDFLRVKEQLEYTLHGHIDMHSVGHRYVVARVFTRRPPDYLPWRPILSRRVAGQLLSAPLGVSCAGLEVVDVASDQANMLIAGTTGSGKSKLLRYILTSIVLRYDAEEAALWLLDMKNCAEFSLFRNLPHVAEIAGDHAEAKRLLKRYAGEMDARGRKLRAAGASHYRQIDKRAALHLLVIDEYAELDDTEKEHVDRVSRLGRACGLHVIVCTQYPKADVLPTSTKGNLNHTVAFRLRTKAASQSVLDVGETAAAELLPVPGRAVYQGSRYTREIQVPYMSRRVAEAVLAPLRAERRVPAEVQP